MDSLNIITDYLDKNYSYYYIYFLVVSIIFTIFYSFKTTITIDRKKLNYINITALLYMFIPSFLFLISIYTSIGIKIILGNIILILFVYHIFKLAGNNIFNDEQPYSIRLDFFILFLSILIFAYFQLFVDKGFLVDWAKHRSVLYSLYLNPIDPSIAAFTFDSNTYNELIPRLVYYYSMYLPSVYIAKLVSLFTQFDTKESVIYLMSLTFFVWNLIGIILACLLIPLSTKKLFNLRNYQNEYSMFFISLIPFSGLNYWLKSYEENKIYVSHSEWTSPYNAQFSSFISLWQWVPSQFVVGMLAIVFLSLYRKKLDRFPICIFGVFVLSGSAWCFIGILFIAIFFLFDYVKPDKICSLKSKIVIFLKATYVDIISFLISTILILNFYSTKTESVQIHINKNLRLSGGIYNYFKFFLVELLPVFLLIFLYLYKKRNIPNILLIIFFTLLVIPVIYSQPLNDFVMRVSIPALCVLFLFSSMIIQYLYIENNSRWIYAVVFIYFLIIIPPFLNEYAMGLITESGLFESLHWSKLYTGKELLINPLIK